VIEIAGRFDLPAPPTTCRPYGNGHINDTFLVQDAAGARYVLQRVNRRVFRQPEAVMANVATVIEHLSQGASSEREHLTLVPLRGAAQPWTVDQAGDYWRMYHFIEHSLCLERAESDQDMRKAGLAFGRFQRALATLPAERLHTTIPGFHDTARYYDRLTTALAADTAGRAADVAPDVAFALDRQDQADLLGGLARDGRLPTRVTHNDTKLNNVLFDATTREPLCVIDLDTVMPGLLVHDFGDSVRFGASTAAEDEPDLARVSFSLPLFEAYAAGFLEGCGDTVTPAEVQHLRDGARLITLEQGVRFLTDYLEADQYYRTTRPGQNLDRARTQFKLVADMENQWEAMGQAVAHLAG
jgi:Ser/Thr protein kinase RdoA (MazF antagonist)